MPELPEVETIKQDLRKQILRKKIKSVLIRKPKLIKSNKKEFVKVLLNSKFQEIDRIGKLMIFKIVETRHGVSLQSQFLLIHLKMTGQLIYQDKKNIIAGGHMNIKDQLPGKQTHIIFEFQDGTKLFFNDQRQFGYMKVVDTKELEKVKEKFGIEPLTPSFTWQNFNKILQNRKTSIKAVILNQKLIAGLGNIYADEALFLAGIRPDKKVNFLLLPEKKKLFSVINPLFKKAIKYRGTTFNNYVDSKGEKGNFSRVLKVFHRDGQKCCRCGALIKKSRVAGRGTHYCPFCQK
ncbi:MAG: bifunctional DNA-formamidopyrimidine glycosylase/DNA-(apurinic or apyrimidinic site) lyase [Patescibacteria group bacterium]